MSTRSALFSLVMWTCVGCAPGTTTGPEPSSPATPVAHDAAKAENLERQSDPEPPEARAEARAIAFVVDRSGSMHGERMEQARAACVEAMQALDAEDRVAVVGFESVPDVYLPLTAAHDAGNAAAVERMEAAGGTEVLGAIDIAGQLLRPAATSHRHMVVLTDGMFPPQGVEELVATLREGGITVSFVALGDELDADFLRELATVGGGELHRVSDPSELRHVFRLEVVRAGELASD